ncbi:MAG TPA: hypothetical protein VFA27_18065 [Vicinamibacterales bacterium]|nr:hypothetical protein [Vicinamibacterales bacterium]
MLIRLALRSLTTRPLRSAILAAGFGLGIGVMVELLGVGQVILEQATAPALNGGGDVVVTGAAGPIESGRFVLGTLLSSARYGSRVRVASPSRRGTLYLVGRGAPMPVSVRGGIPSREQAIGDPEVQTRAWRDTPADTAWLNPRADDILRSLDRFHPIPSPPSARARPEGWAEWLYFNGRARDGSLRFYLSFIAGDVDEGTRPVFVRLQLDRGGRITSYTAQGRVDDRALTEHAPDLDVAGNRVRLVGSQYRISLELSDGASGELTLDAAPGRSLPPVEIRGAHGWLSGYVVPVLTGTFDGVLTIGGERIAIERVAGYHDHNWGYWKDVRWQWGQVASGDLSIVYGRVFPPADVADARRIPGFLGLLGPDGPIAFSTHVTIDEHGDGNVPTGLDVRAEGDQLSLAMSFTVAESERTASFLQLGGTYAVTGRARDRAIAFSAHGSAETFRPAQ